MKILYSIFIFFLEWAFTIASLFNDKVKKGLVGRRTSLHTVKKSFSNADQVIWMHAASLGEYEQGVPVLELLKQEYPSYKIMVTFFSPSGYEIVSKKSTIADAICYLPFDRKSIIEPFVKAVNPKIFFTVKYDYWFHLLQALKNNKTHIFVISALFYHKQIFFKPFGAWMVKVLRATVDWFFHQTQTSMDLAKSVGLEHGSVSGDTRFDRVKKTKNQNNEVEFISDFKKNKKVIVFGSSWEAEEQIALEISKKISDYKIIIAPHDLKRIVYLKQIFPNAILYSELQKSNIQQSTSNILIIDSIGLLSKLYSYAAIAVVGGGFHDKGLHNILEAATFGIPVIFGNKYKKNPEADLLIAKNGAKSFNDQITAAEFIITLTKDENLREEMSDNAERFVNAQSNSSEIILKKIIDTVKS